MPSKQITLTNTDPLSTSANQLVALQSEQDALVRATAAKVGYQLPADYTDPDLIQRDIAANMRRSVEACLEVGKGLAVLKAACGHGQFLPRLDVLGIDTRVAQRFMTSAVKFSNAASTPLLKAIGNQTKLFEMLVLDDEQIEELTELGQTGELTLDDVATMSVKELRAALREAKADNTAKDAVLSDTNKRLTKLQLEAKKKVVADTDWLDALEPLSDQVAAAGRKLAQALSELETCRITLFDTLHSLDDDQSPKFAAAMSHIAEVHEEALARAERGLQKERSMFDKTLADYSDTGDTGGTGEANSSGAEA